MHRASKKQPMLALAFILLSLGIGGIGEQLCCMIPAEAGFGLLVATDAIFFPIMSEQLSRCSDSKALARVRKILYDNI